MQTRERVHQLIDRLPESALEAVEQFVTEQRIANDPLLQVLRNAPEDDEPVTPEDEAALEEAYADVAAGRVFSHEEARRRLFGEP